MPGLLELLLIIVVAVVVPGFFLLLCGLWSIWLAVGRTPVAIRVPVFLLGVMPIGLAWCLFGTRGSEEQLIHYAGWLGLAALTAPILERKYVVLSGFFLLCGLLHATFILQRGNLHVEGFTTTALAMCLLAGLISLIRLFGFRLICFTTDAISQEIEVATGRDVDEWVTILDKQGAGTWNYAQMIIFLRDYGFEYRCQKAIAVAYEKTLGRRSIEYSFDGKAKQIQESIGWTPPQWFSEVSQHRFSIVQLLLWSVAAASFFGFFRLIGRFGLTTEDIAIGGSMIITMALITIAALQVCLGVRNRWPQKLVMLVSVAVSFVAPLAGGFVPNLNQMYVLMVSGMVGYAGWLVAALFLVRQRGYRLVRLQTVSQPTAVPLTPVS